MFKNINNERIKDAMVAGLTGCIGGLVTGVFLGVKLKGRDTITTREVLIVQPDDDQLDLVVKDVNENNFTEEDMEVDVDE